MKLRSFFVAILFVLASTPVLPATHSVGPDGAGAAPTIQAAIDQAVDGDTVLVASGTYSGPGNIDLDFKGKPSLSHRSAEQSALLSTASSRAEVLSSKARKGATACFRDLR